jgi:hypothetical protein
MKTLNIRLDDRDFKKLQSAKWEYADETERVCSWERFLMVMLKSFEGEDGA